MLSKSYASFAQWAADQSPKHRILIRTLRKLMREVAPSLTETVKWTNGCWEGEEWPVVFLHAEDDHLQFGFFSGSVLKDPKKVLEGKGKHVRHVKIRTPKDIDVPGLTRFIRQAVKYERS
jgi:hypothetical protein